LPIRSLCMSLLWLMDRPFFCSSGAPAPLVGDSFMGKTNRVALHGLFARVIIKWG
jgi:hypothetical protein